MDQVRVLTWIMYFYLYSVLGWIFESTYVSLKSGKLVNRGFLKGPFLPIYGSGAVMMLYVSEPFKDNLWLTYIAGVIGATLLELVTGWAIEKIFKVRYWDYSYQKFHFKGYICLSSSIAWGFFTILMNEVIHPHMLQILAMIPIEILKIVFAFTTVAFMIDANASVMEALEIREMMIHLESDLKKELQHMRKRMDVLAAVMEDDRKQFLKDHKEFARIDAFVKQAKSNPTMISQIHRENWQEIHQSLMDIHKEIHQRRKI